VSDFGVSLPDVTQSESQGPGYETPATDGSSGTDTPAETVDDDTSSGSSAKFDPGGSYIDYTHPTAFEGARVYFSNTQGSAEIQDPSTGDTLASISPASGWVETTWGGYANSIRLANVDGSDYMYVREVDVHVVSLPPHAHVIG
jgi:hypothetical protein